MIEETIKNIANLLKLDVHPNFIRMILVGDGLTPQRAETVMLWAKQLNKKESNA